MRAVPGGEGLAWRGAARYVAGTTVQDAFRTACRLDAVGVACSIDQFGELVGDHHRADRVTDEHLQLAEQVTDLPETTWLSVDLSHLGLDVDPARCAERLAAITSALPAGRRIQVGAEDHSRADAVLGCVLDAAERGLADRLRGEGEFRQT